MNFPSKCPHCGKDIADILPSDTHFFPCEKSPGVSASVYTCMHCKKNLYIMRGYIINRSTKKPEVVQDCILSCYPPPKNSEYPETVKKLSPKAYEIYSDAIAAKAYGLDSLVGAGLRIALEHLIWDYLIKTKGLSENELKKMKLEQRIKQIENPKWVANCASIVKTFGNDNIHIFDKHQISHDDAFRIFKILCDSIDSEIIITNNNQKIKSK